MSQRRDNASTVYDSGKEMSFQIKNKRKQLFNLLLDLFVYKQRFPIHKRMKKIRFDTLVLWCLSILMVVQNYRLKLRLEVALCGDGVDIVDLGSNCGDSSIFGDPIIVASCHSTDTSR